MGLKQQIISFSEQEHFAGKVLRYAIKTFGISWRYFYCLSLRGSSLEDNKIVFISHKGKQYSCNPMYISEYLMEKYPGKFRIIWAFSEPGQFAYLKEKGIKIVKQGSKEHMREMMTAKVLVTNVDMYLYLPHIKGQTVLDTWHGGGSYKTCGFMNPQNLDKLRKRLRFERLYSRINLYLSSSEMFSKQTIRQSRHFDGEILETGMPRNDILVRGDRPDIARKVREYFHLGDETKIVLYAPTFRSKKEDDNFQKPDFEGMREALELRFGGEWCVLYRQHHFYKDQEEAISATNYPDMQELLYTADVLVTDYSSSIWDISLMFKPAFLYCPDLEHYTDERNFYMPIEDWPFVLCRSQEELEENIRNFDEDAYREDVKHHHSVLGSYEKGHATEMICERIYQDCFK